MNKPNIAIGQQELKKNNDPVQGEFTQIYGETFYKISNYDKMSPFLMSIVSASDHWIYISSKGGITAGRKNPDNALFPYTNDDKLHDVNEITGSKTIVKVCSGEKQYLWEPFSENYFGIYSVTRNLYKNLSSTEIMFEEINNDLGIKFQYSWTCSENYGFIKTSRIFNNSGKLYEIEILDGIQNILPSGIYSQLQSGFSTLVDGYKKSELVSKYSIGVFSLSSIPSDRALPAESLTATTVWTAGVPVEKFLLCSKQIKNFREGIDLDQEEKIHGMRGAFLTISNFSLSPETNAGWFFAIDINQNAGNLVSIIRAKTKGDDFGFLFQDVIESKRKLEKIVAQADGVQLTGNKLNTARHFSNVLFNIMRGGIFDDGYKVEKDDFILFVRNANPYVVKSFRQFFEELDDQISTWELIEKVIATGDSHFIRLAMEYMPLTFSRRHGDPSRPWNSFSIDIKDQNNEKILNYQGNWRDIFQNWEALALSFPKYLDSMIAKFLNNSTADGYNPYRVFRDGFDWEVLEPHNPWANIGYWGDHQIIYLLKLLEWEKEFNPSSLRQMADTKIFTFANVPYRIKEYKEILNDPRDTIEFDFALDSQLKADEKLFGGDTKFLKKSDQSLVQVNLIEKLLLTLLVKLSNFIPGGGIWMNTQRPEWNDANNALVGYGVSMVTLYYIRRYLNFLKEMINEISEENYNISGETAQFFDNIYDALSDADKIQKIGIDDRSRKIIADKLGKAGSEYRTKIYKKGFTGDSRKISSSMIYEFCVISLSLVETTIKTNKGEDGLYHSYNILSISKDEFKIKHLYEMLEGQVAVLSSGHLSVKESLELLNALKKSRLYREDQNSYMLYPNKELPLFIDKNNIPNDLIKKSRLFEQLLSMGNKEIIYKDIDGGVHFNSDIINTEELKKKLNSLSDPDFRKLAPEELQVILDIHEKTFHHSEFTGRATTFYKYEGLGSIYWHMVSKLLLSVQEVYLHGLQNTEAQENLHKLKLIYYDIKNGIGAGKKPDEYGAFPTDPYSHTPYFTGVQQPGMTGQVKEDIISRLKELGLMVKSGKIVINPSLLRTSEFLNAEEIFRYFDYNSEQQIIKCPKNSLAFTYCQVPFIYHLSDTDKIVVWDNNEKEIKLAGLEFSEEISQSIFVREGNIKKIEIFLSEALLIN
ncbi:MAG: hypothetical protein K9G57_01950 [Ignavibacteriales bacterium]|nr:hypothetical protein [Ignavibacteriales bacterium]